MRLLAAACAALSLHTAVNARLLRVPASRTASGRVSVLLPVRDEAGRVVEWIGTCIDVHDRKTAEAALSESEATLSAVPVLQPGFMLPGPLVPVASPRALLVSPAPGGPAYGGGGVWGPVPHEAPEQAPDLGHGEGERFDGQVVLVLSPRGRPCAARRGRHAPAWRA